MKHHWLKDIADVEGVLHRCTPDEASGWCQRWLAAFGRARHGVNAKAFLWHIFSGARYPCVAGDEARAEYDRHAAARYVLLSNDQQSVFLLDHKPADWPERDFNVFPENLSWNMAFTHEEGWLGPYFARHADYARLEAANQRGLEKRRQAEVARTRGWC